jgi:aromatic ring-opening dioxygenase catalytic subunit (LigB family)
MDWDPPDTWDRMAEYLRRVPDDVGTRPKALVVISGHWEEKVATIQNNPAPPLLYDYYGFSQSTYQISFPAPGAPDVSARIAELLEAAGIGWKYDHLRGFDHGVFTALTFMALNSRARVRRAPTRRARSADRPAHSDPLAPPGRRLAAVANSF